MKKIELHIDDLPILRLDVDGGLEICIPSETAVIGAVEVIVFHNNQFVFSMRCVKSFGLGVSYIFPMLNLKLSRTVFDLYRAIKNEEDGDGC